MKLGRKFKNTLIAAAAFMLATAGMASAEHIEGVYVKYGTPNTVEIRGKYFDDAEGEYATIFILKPGFRGAVADISDFDVDDIEKQKQVKIENGEFSLSFELNTLKTGKYATYIKAGNTDVKYTFSQTSLTEATNYYGNVIGASETDFQSTLESKSWLNLTDTVYSEVDAAAVCKMVYAVKDSIADVNDLREKVLAASYVQALNENKAELVFDALRFIDAECIGLDSLATDKGVNAYELYLGIYDAEGKAVNAISDKGKKALIEQLQGNSYDSVDAFLTDFVGKTTIAAIRYNENTDRTKDILEDNNAVNGFDFTTYNKDTKGKINSLLISSTTWDIGEIKKIVEETEISNSSGSSSGGSSSSGSGSSVSTSTVGGSSGGYSQNYSIGSLSQETTEPEEPTTFADLDSVEWAREAIERLAKLGIVSGRGDGIFAPNDNVTRAEFLTMILNTFGQNTPGSTCDFTDVTEKDWFYQPVAAGTTLGFAAGYDNGAFGAKDNITRQDAVVMLNNAITKLEKELVAKNDGIEFVDANDIAGYAKEAVDTFVKAGVVSGMDDGSFMPLANCTRAQAAVMISNLMDALGMED